MRGFRHPSQACALAMLLALILMAPATASALVYWRDFDTHRVAKPQRVDVALSTSYYWATKLRPWEGWDRARTVGRGKIWANSCRPDCASGNYKAHRGKVILSRIHRCDDDRYYGRIELDRARGGPDLRVRIGCDGDGVSGN